KATPCCFTASAPIAVPRARLLKKPVVLKRLGRNSGLHLPKTQKPPNRAAFVSWGYLKQVPRSCFSGLPGPAAVAVTQAGLWGKHFAGVLAGGVGDFEPAQHAGDFVDAAIGAQKLYLRQGGPLLGGLADLVVVVAAGGHLGQVGDAQHLMARA